MPQASFGYVGVGVESVAGTAVAPTKFLPVKSADFPINVDFIEIKEIRGSRQAYSNFEGPIRPEISLTTSLYPAGAMGVLLRGMFGAYTTAAAGASATAKTHTFIDAATLPSMSFERSDTRTLGSGVLFERVNGVKVESLGFSANYGEDVEVTVKGKGLGFPTTPGSKPGAFTYPSMDPMIFSGASISVDAVANNYFKSLSFEFTNELEPQEALRGSREAYRMSEGGISCTLSGTMIFEDTAMYLAFKNATSMAIKASFQGALIDVPNNIRYLTEFTWPKVKVSSFSTPMEAGSVLEADVEFQVSYDNATSRIVTPTMTNLDVANTYDT